jgi:hypothetical protein
VPKLEEALKELSAALNNAIFVIDPEKPTHAFGNIVDHLARRKQEGLIPSSFDSYRFFQKLHDNGMEASREFASYSESLARGETAVQEKILAYFRSTETPFHSFLQDWKTLLDYLPSAAGVLVTEMDPYKKAAYVVNNSRKLIEQLSERIRELLSHPSDSKETGPVLACKAPQQAEAPTQPQRYYIPCGQDDLTYLERVYTIAEFIITNNITPSIRKKYLSMEMNEARYSYIAKNRQLEAELAKKMKLYKVANAGPFPYISLVAFVKVFANLILISMSAYSQNSVSKDFFDRYCGIKGKTSALMDRIINMEKADMPASKALAFIRTEIVPLIQEWNKQIIHPAIASRLPHSDDLSVLGKDIINKINEIYKLEGAA